MFSHFLPFQASVRRNKWLLNIATWEWWSRASLYMTGRRDDLPATSAECHTPSCTAPHSQCGLLQRFMEFLLLPLSQRRNVEEKLGPTCSVDFLFFSRNFSNSSCYKNAPWHIQWSKHQRWTFVHWFRACSGPPVQLYEVYSWFKKWK